MIQRTSYAIVLLMGMAIFSITGCQRDIYSFTQQFYVPEVSQGPPLIQFVVNNEHAMNMAEHRNLAKVVDYAKLPYGKIDLETFNTTQFIEASTRVLIVCDSRFLSDESITALRNFAALGGTVIITKQSKDERMAFLTGLRPGASMSVDTTAYGFTFLEHVLPGLKGLKLNPFEVLHKGYEASNFSDKVNILASAHNSLDYPLIVENTIGNGKVLLYNSTRELNKFYRGVFFSMVLNGLEGIPYPIANVSSIFLDDFPSPLYESYMEPIKSEMDLTIAEYVTDVWWPDMKQYAKEQNIKYTAYTVFDYNDYVSPPFTFREWDSNTFVKQGIQVEKSTWMGEELLKNGHELGFHGYNHVSLLKSDWPNDNFMVTALHLAVKKWKVIGYGKLPVSYVPPSNYIDSLGLARLHEGMPSIKFIQSTYAGDKEVGEGREFDLDPYNKHFFDFPRVSSGYFLEPKDLLNIESVFLFTGIWTHFVHPDDVYQLPNTSNAETAGQYAFRNKYRMNWYSKDGKEGMFNRFKRDVGQFRQRHPMARFITAGEASELTMDWRYTSFQRQRISGNYLVDATTDNSNIAYWFMYVSHDNAATMEKELLKQGVEISKTPFLAGNMYMLHTQEPYIMVEDVLSIEGKHALDGQMVVEQVERAYDYFIDQVDTQQPLNVRVAKYVAGDKLAKATQLYQGFLEKGGSLSQSQWKDYSKYLSWQGKDQAIWPILENQYKVIQSKDLADISRVLAQVSGYPSEEFHKKWVARQVFWNTTDIKVLEEYIAYFYDAEAKETVLKALKQLNILDPSEENTRHYIQYLLANFEKRALKELNTVAVCSKYYQSLANEISWAYANSNIYGKALEWSDCSTDITEETLNSWLVETADFGKLRQTNYALYMQVLLANNRNAAIRELNEVGICEEDLKVMANDIAYLYADYGEYRKAVDWSYCAANFPFTETMVWLYQLKEYDRLKDEYAIYKKLNPTDYAVQLQMGKLSLYQGEVMKAVEIASKLPPSVEDRELQALINGQVQYLGMQEKRRLLLDYNDILNPEMQHRVKKEIRMAPGNAIRLESYFLNDRKDPNAFINSFNIDINDENYNIHTVSGIRSIMYPVTTDEDYASNETRNLYGMEYSFKSKANDKYQYGFRGRLEQDDYSEIYFQLGANVSFMAPKKFNAFELEHFPVQNGPGHAKEIYRTCFTNYNEFVLSKKLKQIVSLEGNYYSDFEKDATVVGRTEFFVIQKPSFKFSPLAEGGYTLGSVDRRNGYPYWMADSRLYGGGGLALQWGADTGKARFNVDTSFFGVIDQPSFERYRGTLFLRIWNYTALTANAEVYTIDNYNSNIFQVGLAYDF